MPEPVSTDRQRGPASKTIRLFIADGAPNSRRAQANLRAILEKYRPDPINLEIVDVSQEPQRALADHILVTPTLMWVSPPSHQRVIGSLSDEESVIEFLQIGERSHAASP